MLHKRIQKEKQQRDEPAIKVRKFNRKNSKKECYICSLPFDILLKIISYIPYWHIPRLRKSCKLLCSATDTALLHEFQSAIHQSRLIDPNGLEFAALKAINDATCHYVSYGFGSIFCGTVLPLIWNSNQFSIETDKIKPFLKHFYKMANEKCGKPNSQISRLLYCLTLIKLLKQFKNSRVLSSSLIHPHYFRMVLELRGPWMGVLWSPKAAADPHERIKILMMLCEIMIADGTNRAFKKVWECDSEIFVFGNDASGRSASFKNPTTVFTLNICGHNSTITLLKSCLENEVVQLPKVLPKSEFTVSIDILCKEAIKWGCFQVHHIEIGPNDGNNSDEQDDNEEMDLLMTTSSETVYESC